MQKGFSLIILLIGTFILGLVGTGVYFYTKPQIGSCLVGLKGGCNSPQLSTNDQTTPVPTTNLEISSSQQPFPTADSNAQKENLTTYTSPTLKLTFEYPENWKLTEHLSGIFLESPDYEVEDKTLNPNESKIIHGAFFRIDFLDISASYFSDKTYPCIDCIPEDPPRKVQKMTINGYPSIMKEFNDSNQIQINKNGQIYAFGLEFASEDNKNNLMKILSTVKFTEPQKN